MYNSSKYRYFFLAACLSLLLHGCATLPAPLPCVFQPPAGVYHTVEKGQTLWRIAHTYQVDLSEIMLANRLSDPARIEVGQQLLIPRVPYALPVLQYKPLDTGLVREQIRPQSRPAKWKYITLHHSATLKGNAEIFGAYHSKKKMGGLFYHFVLGNGRDSADGLIEQGWRWKKQAYVNRLYDIQICLVGNFNKQCLSQQQFDSLVKLIAVLQKEYGIPLRNIRRHRDIKGKKTDCPGVNFPFYRLLSQLKQYR